MLKKIFISIFALQTFAACSHELNSFPLLDATIKNDTLLIEKLLTNGHDINQINSQRVSSLFAAAYYNNDESLHCLLSHKADCEIPNEHGFTPLYYAASQKHLTTVRFLLKAGANFCCVRDNKTLLEVITSELGYEDVLQEMVNWGHWQYSVNYPTKRQNVAPSLRILAINKMYQQKQIDILIRIINKHQLIGLCDALVNYATYYLPLCEKNIIFKKLANHLNYNEQLNLLYKITKEHTHFYVDNWKQELGEKTLVSIDSKTIEPNIESYFRSIIFPNAAIK